MRKNCSKVIIENFFEPCVLFLLSQKESYGYEIFTALQKKCSCSVNIGNLYRGLARLQKNGYISKEKTVGTLGPDKLVYRITSEGKALLSQWISELEVQNKIIKKLITNYKKQI
jgi:PadR family transcriptional regulator PadR